MRRALVFAITFVPTVALAVGTTYSSVRAPTTFCELVKFLVNILNGVTALMVLAALTAYLYSIFRHMNQVGESSRQQLRDVMLWGFIALFVMVSIWGILRLLQATFFTVPTPTGTAQLC